MSVAAKKKKIFDGRYEILSIVGRGACSVVYHARHAMTQSSEVALKVLLAQKGGGSNTERLRKEALAMVSSRHKFVVRLDDFHSVKDLCYLAMEFAREGDLRKYVTKLGGKLALQQAETFFLQTAEALNFVHRVGITHRDIKPDNILVMNEREIRLADFGVAVLPGELASLEDLRAGVGTMSYMAPEVLEGKACDKLSDIYSLGVSFYEMVSGVHPFENLPLIKQLEGRQDENIKPLEKVVPQIAPHFSQIIMRCLRYDPAARFPSVAELLTAFEKRDAGAASQAQRPADSRTADPSAERRPERREQKRQRGSSADQKERDTRPPEAQARRSRGDSDRKIAAAPFKLRKQPDRKEQRKIHTDEREQHHFTPEEVDPLLESPPDPGSEKSQPVSETTAPAAPSRTKMQESSADQAIIGVDQEPHDAPDETPAENDGGDAENVDAVYYEPESDFSAKFERSDQSDKSAILTVPGRPARRASAPSGVTFSAANLQRLIYLAVGIVLAYIVLQSAAEFFVSEPRTVPPEESASERLIPGVQGDMQSFPALPDGIYRGVISGLMPGLETPLTIIASSSGGTLTFIIGVNGWTPISSTYLDSAARKKRGLRDNQIQIVSNGFVLNFEGSVKDGIVNGRFRNVINGEGGSWSVEPIR